MAERRGRDGGGELLVVRKVLHASAEFLFDAWTEPAVMARWFHAGAAWTTDVVRSDLRPDGAWEIVMKDDGKPVCRVFGKYLEIERPTRLVFTWHPDAREDYETVVTLTFRAIDRDTTELVLSHAGLRDEPDRARHGEGWEGCFASLGRLAETHTGNERRA